MADETVVYITEYTSYTDESPTETTYYDESLWKTIQVPTGMAVEDDLDD